MNAGNTFYFGEGIWKIDGIAPWESVKIKAVPGEPVEMEAVGVLSVHGMPYAPYLSITAEMLQQLKWHDEYRRQGKRYPCPRQCRSKARMSKEWREYGKGMMSVVDLDNAIDSAFGRDRT